MADNNILPVGSVVRLKDIDDPVMVMGYEANLGDVSSDYLGVVYPVGLITDDSALAFDQPAIESVLFEGYLDEEGEKAFAAVRAYRQAGAELIEQAERLADSLTPDRVEELRQRYAPVPMPEGFEVPEGFEDITVI